MFDYTLNATGTICYPSTNICISHLCDNAQQACDVVRQNYKLPEGCYLQATDTGGGFYTCQICQIQEPTIDWSERISVPTSVRGPVFSLIDREENANRQTFVELPGYTILFDPDKFMTGYVFIKEDGISFKSQFLSILSAEPA